MSDTTMTQTHEQVGLEPSTTPIEIHRNAGLAALIGATSSFVAIAYLGRAVASGTTLEWIVALVLGVIGCYHLYTLVDSRTPLLVADEQGVRLRLGRSWRGMPWPALESVEHSPRLNFFRDGRLILHPRELSDVLHELDGAGQRQVALNSWLHGAELAIPLGLSTRVVGVHPEDLTVALVRLAGDATEVVEHGDEDWAEAEADPAADPAAYLEAGDTAEDSVAEVDELDHFAAEVEDLDLAEDPNETTLERLPEIGAEDDLAEDDLAEDELAEDALAEDDAAEDDAAEVDAAEDDRAELEDFAEGEADLGSEEPTDDSAQRPEAALLLGRAKRGAAHVIDVLAGLFTRPAAAAEADDEPVVAASATPEPYREVRTARRAEITRESSGPEFELSTPSAAPEQPLDETQRIRPVPEMGAEPVDVEQTWVTNEPLVSSDDATGDGGADSDLTDEIELTPVVGPEFAAARGRLGLSVESLAERTRIQAHVIEAIEVDDFGPCGGDFYARGHLRTMARVLGIDATDALAAYDEHHASGPINPRQVFEAELASGGTAAIRSTVGGPNWSLLVAAVMVALLAWSIARLVTQDPVGAEQQALLPAGAAPSQVAQTVATDVKVIASNPARVVVRDRTGEVVWTGHLEAGENKKLKVQMPMQVRSSDAGAVRVRVAGKNRGVVGNGSQPASTRYAAPSQ